MIDLALEFNIDPIWIQERPHIILCMSHIIYDIKLQMNCLAKFWHG